METQSIILSQTRLNRLRAQGYTTQTDQTLSDMAFGIRFAYRVCVGVVLIAITFQSIPLFATMMCIAFLGVILPRNPFDYVYNHFLAKALDKPTIPNRSKQIKFACSIATLWLAAIVILMSSGATAFGLILGISLALTAALPSTIDFCVPSAIYNAISKLKFTKTEVKKQVDQVKLEQKVKKMYREVALHPEVSYHFEMGRALAERLGYIPTDLDQIPSEAIDSFAGVGYYFDMAKIQEGENVVDLGSGSGMDVFLAANNVGENGKIIGIDMTKEQLGKSRELKDQYSINNVSFQESYMEQLPLESESVDAVISNGVINLSSEKDKVFQEAARVLKPGGRMAISDIVSMKQLPDSISCNATLWAACIGGAMQIDDYYSIIEDAGFTVQEVKKNPYSFMSSGALSATRNYGIMSISLVAIKK
jgi:SAM-dependent methyltransferase